MWFLNRDVPGGGFSKGEGWLVAECRVGIRRGVAVSIKCQPSARGGRLSDEEMGIQNAGRVEVEIVPAYY